MNRTAEIAHQKSLGPFLRYYYGVDLYKCCDVFPKLEHTKDFKDLCYWKCPVCGRETAKYEMPWMASKEWQEMTKPFEQISIWDILGEPKQEPDDFPCDTCEHDVKGCCDYDEPLGRNCVLGDAYQERKPWKKILYGQDVIQDWSDLKKYERQENEPEVITHISKGAVDGVMAWIGYGTYVSGWNGEFTEILPAYWKERQA